MGRTVGYMYLLKHIQSLWRPLSHIEFIATHGDYFLVKFSSLDYYNHAKYEGPWMVFDHYLIVNEWYPDFDSISDTTERMLVCVRFPCLPIEYYHQGFLIRIAEKLGKPIKVDHATSLTNRGMFARVCIEVDITKPLKSKFMVKRKVRVVEYEGMHLICFNWGMHGHSKEWCSLN